MSILFIILSIIFCAVAGGCLYKAQKKLTEAESIKYHKTQQQEEYDRKYEELKNEINGLSKQRTSLLLDIAKEKQQIEDLYLQEKNKITEQIELYKNNTSYASEQYVYHLEQEQKKAEQEYYNKLEQLNQQEQNQKKLLQQYMKKINDLKETLNAGTRAKLREREKEENLNFYKLHLTQNELDDVLKLNSLKYSLHNPTILSKLIWSTYFQKQTTEMCNRILGTDKVCGIYKITNIKTQQCYIGQSVDVAQRWKNHVKCGLGIEASATNKLYNSMIEQGVWNFTFELLERCEQAQLNEKEAFWIKMYQAYELGYNSNKGVNK